MPSGIAIFELQVNIPNRTHPDNGKRQSAIAGAAYRAGETLTDHQTGEIHYYSKRTGVEHSEIVAPENAPNWVYDREELWNRHDVMERQHNSQLFREVRVALPKAFDSEQNITLTREWVRDNFVDKGMVADIAFHDMSEDDSNPHAHIMLSMRHLQEENFGNKNREWNNYSPVLKLSKDFRDENDIDFKSDVAKWRASWSLHVNEHLETAGIEARISHLSKAEAKKLEQQEALAQMNKDMAKWWETKHSQTKGRALEPEQMPLSAYHMEQRGIETRAGNWLEGVKVRNAARDQAARHEQHLQKHFEVKDSQELAQQMGDIWGGVAEWWEAEHSEAFDRSDGWDLEYG